MSAEAWVLEGALSACLPSLVEGKAIGLGARPGVPSRVTSFPPLSACLSDSSKSSPSSPLGQPPLLGVAGSASALLVPALRGLHSLVWHTGGT